jgi:hypothetical protein
MTDLALWNVHGPVDTLRTETAEWDRVKEGWQPAKLQTVVRFRPDGQIAEAEYHNPDGSIARRTCVYNDAGQILEARFQTKDGPVSKTISSYDNSGRLVRTVNIDENGARTESEIYRYDSSGRKTRVQFLPKVEGNVGYSMDVEGALAMFGTSGAATMTTAYDDQDRANEVLIHDASHRLLRRMTYTRDSAGRLLKEEVKLDRGAPFPDMEERLKEAPPEARESLQAALATILGANNPLSNTYAYDEKGRQVEKIMRMGLLGEHRTTFHFDDHDNPIEEVSEDINREVRMDEQGHPQPSSESSHNQHTRFVYKYDAKGNWTEREVWIIFEPKKDFQRSNIERRQISYYLAGSGLR